MKRDYTFYVYILTNPSKTTLYIGFTNSLSRRLDEHKANKGNRKTFSGKYLTYQLIYFEVYKYVNNAIAREKQLKNWSRAKKETLINKTNPNWDILNDNFYIV